MKDSGCKNPSKNQNFTYFHIYYLICFFIKFIHNYYILNNYSKCFEKSCNFNAFFFNTVVKVSVIVSVEKIMEQIGTILVLQNMQLIQI